ncbi:MAG: hypothetical protein R6V83_08200 [Candidatus Thorarchaeota archaeon]
MRMESSVHLPKKLHPVEYSRGEDLIELHVFTNDTCMFHDETMRLVQNVAQEISSYGHRIKVRMQSIKDCEEQNILALPTLVVGNTQITGLPTRSELAEILRDSIPHCGADIQ